MIYVKVAVQIITSLTGIVALTLDYKWSDGRTNKFKNFRIAAFILMPVLLILSLWITIDDDSEKTSQITDLKLSVEAARSTLSSVEENGNAIKKQLEPFLKIAERNYPELDANTALNELSSKMIKLDSSLFSEKMKVKNLEESSEKLKNRTDKISSATMDLVIEEKTPISNVGGKETSSGISSYLAFFLRDGTRLRFGTDGTFSRQQISPTRIKYSLTYVPEDKNQILGKDISIFNNVEILAVDYSSVPEFFDVESGKRQQSLYAEIFINGQKIPILEKYPLKIGQLMSGQINIPVQLSFDSIKTKL